MATLAKIIFTLTLIALSMMARANMQGENTAQVCESVEAENPNLLPVLEADEDGVFRNYRIPEDDMVYIYTSTNAPTRAVNHGGNVVLISNWPGEGGPFINL